MFNYNVSHSRVSFPVSASTLSAEVLSTKYVPIFATLTARVLLVAVPPTVIYSPPSIAVIPPATAA